MNNSEETMIFKGERTMEKLHSYLYILQSIFLNGKGICFILCDTSRKILGGGFCAMSEETVHSGNR